MIPAQKLVVKKQKAGANVIFHITQRHSKGDTLMLKQAENIFLNTAVHSKQEP